MEDEIKQLKIRIARLEAERAVQSTFTEYLYNLDIGLYRWNNGCLC